MKKGFLILASMCALVVLTGCATMSNMYIDNWTTVFLPDGTVQWAQSIDERADSIKSTAETNIKNKRDILDYSKPLTKNEVNNIEKEVANYRKETQKYISDTALLSQEELEAQGRKVYPFDLIDKSDICKRMEQRLRELPPGTRMVFSGARIDQHQQLGLGFLDDDGSFVYFLVED